MWTKTRKYLSENKEKIRRILEKVEIFSRGGSEEILKKSEEYTREKANIEKVKRK